MFRPKNLQQRLTIFVLIPVALLLIAMGVVGFIYARNSLLAQWREAALLKLQRAAHQVDMRLARTKDWIQFIAEAYEGQQTPVLRAWAIEKLKKLESVDHVHLTSLDKHMLDEDGSLEQMPPMSHETAGRHQERIGQRIMMRRFHSARIRQITPPRYDEAVAHETVSLISDLNDEQGQSVGKLEVVLDFDILIKNIRGAGWWQSNKAFLVDDSGRIFAAAGPERRGLQFGSEDRLEGATVKAMKTAPSGTILGEGHPPTEVSGFYRLQEAPWSLVMIAPGKEILAPIVRFRLYYFAIVAGFVFLIVVLIKLVNEKTVSAIKDLSQAARRIASGNFGQPLPVKTRDEVGELTRSFNTMMSQLEERIRIKQALDVAMEVQQNFLPLETPRVPGLDIAATSIYCDETGGDFYDFLEIHRRPAACLGLAVGDVSGHGISAALLMATVRAFVKSNVGRSESIAASIASINRLLTQDTRDSGQFVTLFYAEITPVEKTLRWVRAGHDPAIFYRPGLDKFEKLQGQGLALGIDEAFAYQENSLEELSAGDIVIIGTDGLWEAQNNEGKMFGKRRLMNLVRRHSNSPSDTILNAIIESLKTFQDSAKQEDDVTLMVIKVIE